MLKKTKALAQLNRLIYSSAIEESSSGTINITDNSVLLDMVGAFKVLKIVYKGNIFIYNKLPEGYSIRVNDNVIRIVNLLGRNLPNDKIIFNFDGNMNIYKAEVKTFNANKFLLDIENINELRLVDKSKTKVEDDTLLIIDEPASEEVLIRRSQVDDDTIRGLYTDKQFKNGYSGYYNYSPSRKSFATGRELTNNSTAIGNKTGFAKNIIKKQKIQPVITTQKTPEVKPLKTKKKEPIKRSKY
tara:strand:- start:361 stop:1089 length:729 start_codon:yes stop_codon:yes gene_type:complete